MTKPQRAIINECCFVTRRLKLVDLDPAKAESIRQAIDEIMGVDRVSLTHDSATLNVAYDAGKVRLETLEAIIHRQGAAIASGWWTRFKESWYRFSDDNVRDQKEREPWSCH